MKIHLLFFVEPHPLLPSMILYLVHSNINLFYGLHYPARITRLQGEMKMNCNAKRTRCEEAKFSGRLLVVFTSKADGLRVVTEFVPNLRLPQRDVFGGEAGGRGGLEKFAGGVCRVTTQQSDLKSVKFSIARLSVYGQST